MRVQHSLLILGLIVAANAAHHHIKLKADSQYSFAILSDIHIGESPTVSELNDLCHWAASFSPVSLLELNLI